MRAIMVRDDAVDVLARVFYDEARARDLLERAEIPIGRLPPWGTLNAEMFWRSVLRELEHGALWTSWSVFVVTRKSLTTCFSLKRHG